MSAKEYLEADETDRMVYEAVLRIANEHHNQQMQDWAKMIEVGVARGIGLALGG